MRRKVSRLGLILILLISGLLAFPEGVPADVATRGATANEVVTTGWTNAANAHGTADDNTYATAAPGKNAVVGSRFKTYGFDSVIPAGSTITAVKIIPQYKVSTTASIAHLHVQATVAGTDCPTTALENTAEPTADTDVTVDVTSCRSWTRDDLLDANFKVRIGAHRGNSNTAVTFSLDRVLVEVTFTPPAAGSLTIIDWREVY